MCQLKDLAKLYAKGYAKENGARSFKLIPCHFSQGGIGKPLPHYNPEQPHLYNDKADFFTWAYAGHVICNAGANEVQYTGGSGQYEKRSFYEVDGYTKPVIFQDFSYGTTWHFTGYLIQFIY